MVNLKLNWTIVMDVLYIKEINVVKILNVRIISVSNVIKIIIEIIIHKKIQNMDINNIYKINKIH